MKRRTIEADADVADVVRVLCFLRGIKMRVFVTDALRKAVEPYESWIESFRKIQGRP